MAISLKLSDIMTDPFEHIPEPPDLSGQVKILSYRPVFTGAYSSVYRGTMNETGRMVAIKVINAVKGSALHTMKRKLQRERRTWGALNHPNILPLYGFANGDELFEPFGALISPWLQDGDAADYLEVRGDSLGVEKRLDLWKDVIAGVEYLHSHTPLLVHGDIKSKNILIDESGHAMLCDFGLVRIFLDEGSSGMTTTSHHTGTERYLAYELVIAGEDANPTTASDVYAVGCVGLEFIFSQIPYCGRRNNLGGMIFADIKSRKPPAVRPADLPVRLQGIWGYLEQCWDLKPDNRPSATLLWCWTSDITLLSSPPGTDITKLLEEPSHDSPILRPLSHADGVSRTPTALPDGIGGLEFDATQTPDGAPPGVVEPPWQFGRTRSSSWYAWQPDPRYAPSSPGSSPIYEIPDSRPLGFFGPRSLSDTSASDSGTNSDPPPDLNTEPSYQDIQKIVEYGRAYPDAAIPPHLLLVPSFCELENNHGWCLIGNCGVKRAHQKSESLYDPSNDITRRTFEQLCNHIREEHFGEPVHREAVQDEADDNSGDSPAVTNGSLGSLPRASMRTAPIPGPSMQVDPSNFSAPPEPNEESPSSLNSGIRGLESAFEQPTKLETDPQVGGITQQEDKHGESA